MNLETAGQLEQLKRRVADLEDLTQRLQAQADEERALRIRQHAAFERQHGFVKLLETVAVAANEAPSVPAALRIALEGVCGHTGWPVGHVFVVERSSVGRLVPIGPWYLADPPRYESFRRATEEMAFEVGRGLPGLALERRLPVWKVNLSSDPEFLRAAQAAAIGLQAGFAFPIMVRDEVVAVLEFYGHEPEPPDDDLIDIGRHIGTLLGRIVERKHAEDALRVTRGQQQALSRRLLEIQELERSRIARELHDQIGQALTAVKLNLEAIQHMGSASGHAAEINESITAIDQAIEQVRTLSFELRPALLDDLGLAVAVGSYARRQAAKAGFELRLSVDRFDDRIRKDVETACFRILQEALTNVVRHAWASIVEVELHESNSILDLTVRDDGAGFAGESREGARQLGLLGMRERAQNVGCVFSVESEPTKGTTVRARLPLHAANRLERRETHRTV